MLFTLVYHTYLESKTENFVLRDIFIDSKERIMGSTLNMQNVKLRCCVQTTDVKGLLFSDFLDQCSLLVVKAKFDMSDDLVRSILKAKMYTFWSLNMLVKCNSCNNFVNLLFNLSPFAAKYCSVM